MRIGSSAASMVVDPWNVLCQWGKRTVETRSLNDRPGFRLSVTGLTVAVNLFVVYKIILLLLGVKLWQACRGGIGDPEAGCAQQV